MNSDPIIDIVKVVDNVSNSDNKDEKSVEDISISEGSSSDPIIEDIVTVVDKVNNPEASTEDIGSLPPPSGPTHYAIVFKVNKQNKDNFETVFIYSLNDNLAAKIADNANTEPKSDYTHLLLHGILNNNNLEGLDVKYLNEKDVQEIHDLLITNKDGKVCDFWGVENNGSSSKKKCVNYGLMEGTDSFDLNQINFSDPGDKECEGDFINVSEIGILTITFSNASSSSQGTNSSKGVTSVDSTGKDDDATVADATDDKSTTGNQTQAEVDADADEKNVNTDLDLQKAIDTTILNDFINDFLNNNLVKGSEEEELPSRSNEQSQAKLVRGINQDIKSNQEKRRKEAEQAIWEEKRKNLEENPWKKEELTEIEKEAKKEALLSLIDSLNNGNFDTMKTEIIKELDGGADPNYKKELRFPVFYEFLKKIAYQTNPNIDSIKEIINKFKEKDVNLDDNDQMFQQETQRSPFIYWNALHNSTSNKMDEKLFNEVNDLLKSENQIKDNQGTKPSDYDSKKKENAKKIKIPIFKQVYEFTDSDGKPQTGTFESFKKKDSNKFLYLMKSNGQEYLTEGPFIETDQTVVKRDSLDDQNKGKRTFEKDENVGFEKTYEYGNNPKYIVLGKVDKVEHINIKKIKKQDMINVKDCCDQITIKTEEGQTVYLYDEDKETTIYKIK